MTATAVIGLQWGDEGKGKIVDFVAKDFDVVARFNGGSNAGHTVVLNGRKMTFHLLPCGALRGKKLLIGNGVLVDPEELRKEVDEVSSYGLQPDLHISDRAHVVLPFHKIRDRLDEVRRAGRRIGTTLRGIGPCQVDKVGRVGVRVSDLVNEGPSARAFKESLSWNLSLIKRFYGGTAQLDDMFPAGYVELLKEYMADTALIANELLSKGAKILLEGAQGFYLDADFGTYPYVTSTNTLPGYASVGLGIPPYLIREIVGVAKAYTTRVGEGPFVTELKDGEGRWIAERGAEYGATTGRPRRVGWFDAVAVSYAAKVSGATSIALTKVDILSGLKKVKLCKAYRFGERPLQTPPPDASTLHKCVPVYEELEGWGEMDDEGWRKIVEGGYSYMPKSLAKYIERISELVSLPISYVGFGEERERIVVTLG